MTPGFIVPMCKIVLYLMNSGLAIGPDKLSHKACLGMP